MTASFALAESITDGMVELAIIGMSKSIVPGSAVTRSSEKRFSASVLFSASRIQPISRAAGNAAGAAHPPVDVVSPMRLDLTLVARRIL
jgi:hypothetical protein